MCGQMYQSCMESRGRWLFDADGPTTVMQSISQAYMHMQIHHSHLKFSSSDDDIAISLRVGRCFTWGSLAVGRRAVYGHQLEGLGELLHQLLG